MFKKTALFSQGGIPKSNGSYVIKDLGTFIFFFQGKFPMGGKAAKDLEEIQVKADSFI